MTSAVDNNSQTDIITEARVSVSTICKSRTKSHEVITNYKHLHCYSQSLFRTPITGTISDILQ